VDCPTFRVVLLKRDQQLEQRAYLVGPNCGRRDSMSTEAATDTSGIPILLVFETIVIVVRAVWGIRDICQSAAAGVDTANRVHRAMSGVI